MNRKKKHKVLGQFDGFSVVETFYSIPENENYKFQYIDKPNSVLSIISYENKIGLLEINRFLIGNSLELVGGRIKSTDLNEFEAIKRELFEEINIKDFHLTLISEIFPLPNITNEKVFLFNCELLQSKISINREEGILGFHFYEVKEIIKLLFENQIKSAVDAYSLMYFLLKNNKLK